LKECEIYGDEQCQQLSVIPSRQSCRYYPSKCKSIDKTCKECSTWNGKCKMPKKIPKKTPKKGKAKGYRAAKVDDDLFICMGSSIGDCSYQQSLESIKNLTETECQKQCDDVFRGECQFYAYFRFNLNLLKLL
jgi:hypothetical protein